MQALNAMRFGFRGDIHQLGSERKPDDCRQTMLHVAADVARHIQEHPDSFSSSSKSENAGHLPAFAFVHTGAKQAYVVGLDMLWNIYSRSMATLASDRLNDPDNWVLGTVTPPYRSLSSQT